MCKMLHRHSVLCVMPPHMLDHILVHGSQNQRRAAVLTKSVTSSLRYMRHTEQLLANQRAERDYADTAGSHKLKRVIRNSRNLEVAGGTIIRKEGQAAISDVAANEAYDGLGATWNFYLEQFQRYGIDGHGSPLFGFVHYGRNYDNAFYDGREMCFGDGDGELFNRFTIALDVIGHELSHGVTEACAGLDYHDQPGALNESVSDVMGAVIRQTVLGLKFDDPDGWLIGKGLLADHVSGRALRDMRAPGTAYDDPILGKDPQPANMAGYVRTTQDNGGVHVNSGIPNRAAYLLAQNLQNSLKCAHIWYETLRSDAVGQECDFVTWAHAQLAEAERLFGDDGLKAATDAWEQVGVLTSATS
jgi:Zn-dependent metalloprotease